MERKIKMPKELKAKVMLWTDISYYDMEKLNQISSVPELQMALCEVLDIDLREPKRGILLDLYVQTILYCREKHFKPEQSSTLLSIIKSIHMANTETPLNNITYCHTYCRELLFCHSVHQPPFSVDLFDLEEVTSIYNFINSSYMRHCRLYKFLFTPQMQLDLTLTYSEDSVDQKDDSVSSASTEYVIDNPQIIDVEEETDLGSERGCVCENDAK